jgi:hypothetical protein
MVSRASLAVLFVLLAPLAATARIPVAAGPDLPLTGDPGDGSPPAIAFLPGGDLLQISPRLWDDESCFRGWAPCIGPLRATLVDRFEPGITRAFQVQTPDEPRWPEAVRIANGSGDSFLVVWQERPYCNIRFGKCYGDDGVMARFFLHPDAPGGPLLRVAATAGGPVHPAVAALRGGGFVVVWQSVGSAASTSLLGQRYDAAGNPVGGELPLAQGVTPDAAPAVAAGDGGSFLVAWARGGDSTAAGLFARLFGADGSPAGGELRVDTGAAGTAGAPALAALAHGGFALAWSGGSGSIWARRLDVSGTPAGAPVRASSQALDPATAAETTQPDLASDAADGFFVVWQRHEATAGSGGVTRVLGTYFGAPTEEPVRELQVAASAGSMQFGPRITSDGGYGYAIVWQGQMLPSPSPFLPSSVYSLRRYNVPGAPCTSDAGTLCLGGGRFRVETRWRDQHGGGTLGYGSALSFSDATGLFWFFDSSNVELIVKVLDGTSLDDDFWFFYGALSDVEYWIRATDTATGRLALYHNPPGRICGRGDTRAFPQPPAAAATASAGLPATVLAGLRAAASAQAATPACTADPTTLCLLGGRFAVRVDWIDQHGYGTGAGRAIPSTDATGLFWFFDPGNVELAVKVLDGRAVDGKFWVFYGGLSDVEYTVRVTDTLTGAVRAYHNAPGNLCGHADTRAF